MSAPTSISTTVRRDPYRVTTKLEPDTSFGSQAPFTAFFSTLTAPRHRTLTGIGLHAGVLPKTFVKLMRWIGVLIKIKHGRIQEVMVRIQSQAVQPLHVWSMALKEQAKPRF